jgi:hypothetical protein
MTQTMTPVAPELEYRFNNSPGEHDCPLCGTAFLTTIGSWPFLAGSPAPVCGTCVTAEDPVHASPCDTLFAFCDMSRATLVAVQSADGTEPVAERLRLVALDEGLPVADRDILNRASIDLAFWEADSTRIVATEPRLVVQTCPEAAAELLLSACGDIL